MDAYKQRNAGPACAEHGDERGTETLSVATRMKLREKGIGECLLNTAVNKTPIRFQKGVLADENAYEETANFERAVNNPSEA